MSSKGPARRFEKPCPGPFRCASQVGCEGCLSWSLSRVASQKQAVFGSIRPPACDFGDFVPKGSALSLVFQGAV